MRTSLTFRNTFNPMTLPNGGIIQKFYPFWFLWLDQILSNHMAHPMFLQRAFNDIPSTSLRSLCRWFDVFVSVGMQLYSSAKRSWSFGKLCEWNSSNMQCSRTLCYYFFGFGVASFLYNCALCFDYLAIITYNKKNDYIKVKLEPLFHGISVTIVLAIGIIGLLVQVG